MLSIFVASPLRLLALVLCLGWYPVQAQVNDSLHNFLHGLQNLSADFNQIEFDEHRNEVRRSQGILHLQRPKRFRWEYQTPYLQTIVSDGINVWIYDHELAQVTVKPYSNALAHSPALLLSSDEPLDNHFTIEEAGTRDGLEWIKLLPKISEAGFVKAEMGFIGKELHTMELLDNFGQTTSLIFSHLKRNLSLSGDLFNFLPPPGVDVVGKGR